MKTKTRRLLISYLLILGLAVALLGPIAALAANTSACYNIGDADARTYCLARAHREPAQCYSIQRADLRAQCLAEVHQ